MTDLDELVALERSLLASSIRADAAALDGLLHPDFEEVGSSGTVWTRDAIIRALTDEEGDSYLPEVVEIRAEPVGDDVAFVRFTTRTDDHLVHRLTVWVRTEAGAWQARYHQGTRAPGS